ncbi:MAG: choice-of-anchor R domain-containing protein, partial [Candidatus Diapherotrites archaeon]|nr:choice-of-anchor R domain-containing protein [Candidatus Diapherotrites archaeon]
MPFCSFRFSDKGFALSADILIAVFLAISFLSVAFVSQYSGQPVSDSVYLKQLARDTVVSLDESGFVVSTFDRNDLTDDQKMDVVAGQMSALLPSNTRYRVELTQYDFNAALCQQSPSFSGCFGASVAFGARGKSLPTDRTVVSDQIGFFRKGSPVACAVEPGTLSLASIRTRVDSERIALFSSADHPQPLRARALFSDAVAESRISLQQSQDANVVFGASVSPTGSVSCDADVTVDLNVSVIAFGRKPVDIAFVMDRSGSMSGGGVAATTDLLQVAVDHHTAYLADGWGGFRTADVNAPSLPGLLYKNPAWAAANGVAFQNNYVFEAVDRSSVIYDVTTTFVTFSNNDVRIGYSAAESWAGQSFVTNNGVVSGAELYVRRTGNPNDLNVHIRSSINGPDLASVGVTAGTLSTSYAWVKIDFASPVTLTAGSTYFVVLSTTSQSTSNYYRWASSKNTNPYSGGGAYQQTNPINNADMLLRTYVYEGIQVIDVSNRLSPRLVGTSRVNSAQKLFVRNNQLLLGDGTNGFKIFDITTPNRPALLGQVPTTDARGVFAYGNFAFVADRTSGLRIINITNPAAPTLTATYNTPGTANMVYVDRNFAFVADGSTLQIINVSNPVAPTLAAVFDTPGNAQDVWIDRNKAYVA